MDYVVGLGPLDWGGGFGRLSNLPDRPGRERLGTIPDPESSLRVRFSARRKRAFLFGNPDTSTHTPRIFQPRKGKTC